MLLLLAEPILGKSAPPCDAQERHACHFLPGAVISFITAAHWQPVCVQFLISKLKRVYFSFVDGSYISRRIKAAVQDVLGS